MDHWHFWSSQTGGGLGFLQLQVVKMRAESFSFAKDFFPADMRHQSGRRLHLQQMFAFVRYPKSNVQHCQDIRFEPSPGGLRGFGHVYRFVGFLEAAHVFNVGWLKLYLAKLS